MDRLVRLGHEADDMTGFVGRLTAFRERFAQIRARQWVVGKKTDGSYGVLWLTPDGNEMTEADWNFPEGRFLSFVLGPDGAWPAGALRRT